MPLYSYECQACGHKFETLVRGGETPECSSCGSTCLSQMLSLIAEPAKGAQAAMPACGTPGACGGTGPCGVAGGGCPAFGNGFN